MQGIVKLREVVEDSDDRLDLILEHLKGGDCAALLTRCGRLSERIAVGLLAQLLAALAHCHDRGVAHRDVHPGNVAFASSVACHRHRCKLVDFGYAARAPSGMSSSSDTPFREVVGSAPYMAPEMLARRPAYGFKVDVWSAGALACELLTGQPPCGTGCQDGSDPQAQLLRRIRRYATAADPEAELRAAAPDGRWDELSKGARDFLLWTLQADPKKRPSAEEACRHPWLWEEARGLPRALLGG